jgi:hypothetical protein
MKKNILVYLSLILILSACNSDFWNKKIDFGKAFKDVKETVNPKVVEKQKKIDTTGLWDSIETDPVNLDNFDKPLIRDKNEQKICDMILALPEVKERAKYVEKQTKGKRHLMVWIYDTPKESNEEYYWVKAGEDNGTNYVTHFNFYVYPKNNEIKFYDVVNDTVISLTTWRKELKSGK